MLYKKVIFVLTLLLIFLSLKSCLKNCNNSYEAKSLKINFPLNGTIYPKNFRSPLFSWEDAKDLNSEWDIIIKTPLKKYKFKSKKNIWHIPFSKWINIRDSSINQNVIMIISGETKNNIKLTGKVNFSISPNDLVGNILYREVPLPFGFAGMHLYLIKYNIINLAENGPPKTIVKPSEGDRINACLSCHSISENADKFAIMSKTKELESFITMSIDSKSNLAKEQDVFNDKMLEKIINEKTSVNKLNFNTNKFHYPQISPDGKHVVFVANFVSAFYLSPKDKVQPFTINPYHSYLGIYSTEEKRFWTLPGANEPGHIYYNPMWSPDGKFITYSFAKSPPEALELKQNITFENISKIEPDKHYLMPKGLEFDLYTISFNNGRGGKPKVIEATRNNGLFDYFPEYSPDGKWIVYTSSKLGTNVFLNPDSTLYITSTKNDKVSKKLSSNFEGVMNSWHKFSLDGNWLIFTARPDGKKTDLFLTQINKDGKASPPIILDGLARENYAVNIPIFTKMEKDTIIQIPPDGLCNAAPQPFNKHENICIKCHRSNPYNN